MIVNALLKLRPNALWEVGQGNTYADIVWKDENETIPTEEEINIAIAECQAEITANTYKKIRSYQYPKIEEQLDMLWHAIDNGTLDKTSDFYTTLKQVKDDNPKPTE